MEALPVTPKLPQPLRQVDKVLTSLVEKAVQLSESKKEGKSQTGVSYEEPGLTVLPSAHSEPLGVVTCVALSSDERHLFAGLASGQLLAVSTTTGSVIASLEVGEGPIDTVAEIILCPNGDSDRGVAAVEEDGGEAFAVWKVLVVAAGGEVHFFRVSGVLEDNAFIHFATAQLPPGTRTGRLKAPGMGSTSPVQTRGGVKTVGISFDAGLFWASTQNGALVIFPLPSPPPPQEATSDTPPILQLTPLFILPPGTPAAAAGFTDSPSPSESPTGSVNTHPESIVASDEHLRFGLRTVSLREKPGDAKPAWFCELYVWWEGRNRILMYEVPWKGPGKAVEKGAVAEPRKGREWTMPHMVTSGALSADGALMAVGLGDGTLVLIDLHLCLTHRLFQRLDGPVTTVAFTECSTRRPPEALVAVSSGGEMKVHRLTGENSAVPVRKGVTDVAVQEGTSRALLFTDDERHVQLIDFNTGAVLGSFFPGEGSLCSRAQNPSPRLWAYTGRHVLAQIAHRIEERKEEGHVATDIEGDAGNASPQTAGGGLQVEHPPSESREPSACLLFYSLQDAALSRHSDSFAGLFGGPQLLERLLHDSASVKGKAADGSRRPSILQMSPRGKPSRHGSTTAAPLESPQDATCPPRHMSISSESPPNRPSQTSPSVGVNKPYPSPRTNPLGVNKPLPLGQQSLTRESSLRNARGSEAGSAASPRGDPASKASPGGSPRRGGLKPASPKGKIVGLPVAAKEEAAVDVGYRDAVPAILDRLSSKGGGRSAREQRMRQRQEEMLQELATNQVEALRKFA